MSTTSRSGRPASHLLIMFGAAFRNSWIRVHSGPSRLGAPKLNGAGKFPGTPATEQLLAEPPGRPAPVVPRQFGGRSSAPKAAAASSTRPLRVDAGEVPATSASMSRAPPEVRQLTGPHQPETRPDEGDHPPARAAISRVRHRPRRNSTPVPPSDRRFASSATSRASGPRPRRSSTSLTRIWRPRGRAGEGQRLGRCLKWASAASWSWCTASIRILWRAISRCRAGRRGIRTRRASGRMRFGGRVLAPNVRDDC